MVQEKDYFVIESRNDFLSWKILHTEDWKPGVKRLHLTHHALDGKVHFRLAYCDEKYLKKEKE